MIQPLHGTGCMHRIQYWCTSAPMNLDCSSSRPRSALSERSNHTFQALTAPLASWWEAKLSDDKYPSTDHPWAVRRTPVPPTTQSRAASAATGASRRISKADGLGLLLSCPHGRPDAESTLAANEMRKWRVVSATGVAQRKMGMLFARSARVL